MKTGLLVLVAAGVAFVAITWWALEADGVAIVESTQPDGASRFTHVWFVDADGERWLEAGTPESGWYRDLAHDPFVRLLPGGDATCHLARPSTGAAGHDRIRSFMRAKYGWRDRWVALVFDTSRSVAVALEPNGEGCRFRVPRDD